MKLLAFAFTILLFLTAGCSTVVPVTVKFPEVPSMLLDKCPQLKTIEINPTSIVDYTKTVTLNYTTYYECAVKNDAWVEWYRIQKHIFEEVSK
jgi:hypothetical protein